MGKGAIIAALALTVLLVTLQNSSRLTHLEAEAQTSDHQNSQVARDLAMEARKLVLAHWVSTAGAGMTAPFDTVSSAGGIYFIEDYTRTSNVLDYTVRSAYQGAVHEIRSRYEWVDYAATGMQIKAADLNAVISPLADINVDGIAIDDQSLLDLGELLVDELGVVTSLGDLGLGWIDLQDDLAVAMSGHAADIYPITQAERDAFDTSAGIFFPDQVSQAVASFVTSHPSASYSVPDASALGATFGIVDGYEVLTVTGDLNLTNDLQGEGVLVVEGNLRVPAGVTLDWTGIVLVRPPSSNQNPVVDLSGDVDISGSLVAMQEGVPNFGHMDVSVLRDYGGTWALPSGQDPLYYAHTHDYSGTHGWQVLFRTDTTPTVPLSATRFDTFVGAYDPGTMVSLELVNTNKHGRALLTMELAGEDRYTHPVASGFDPNLRSAGNANLSRTFPIGDLVYLDLLVTRLSALNRLWDSDNPYDACAYNSVTVSRTWGTNCTWGTPNRMGNFTLRLRLDDGTTVYEAPLYWHRKKTEADDLEEEMEDLVDHIVSNDYGLDLTVGPDATLEPNAAAIAGLGAFLGNPLGLGPLGTWQRQWASDDPSNPLY